MKVAVELNQTLKVIFERQGERLDLQQLTLIDNCTLADLVKELGLKRDLLGFAIINGNVVADLDHKLEEGDEIVLYGPLAGG